MIAQSGTNSRYHWYQIGYQAFHATECNRKRAEASIKTNSIPAPLPARTLWPQTTRTDVGILALCETGVLRQSDSWVVGKASIRSSTKLKKQLPVCGHSPGTALMSDFAIMSSRRELKQSIGCFHLSGKPVLQPVGWPCGYSNEGGVKTCG